MSTVGTYLLNFRLFYKFEKSLRGTLQAGNKQVKSPRSQILGIKSNWQ